VTAGSGTQATSTTLESMPGNAGVMRRMLGIAVVEVVLHRTQIGALVGEIIAAAVAEHLRPGARASRSRRQGARCS
jgi:hypothetical protein